MTVAGTTAITELWAKCKAFFAAKSHAHAASDIISGELPIGRGGTGASSASAARTNLGAQASLVSGTNIKTVNNQSLLGSGNIAIVGTGDLTDDYGSWADSETMNEQAAVYYDIEDDSFHVDCLPVEAGGTGAYSASAARTNLGAAAASHEHAASDISSGTLAIARIPTGTSGTTVALGNHSHSGYADASHEHAADDISSGTLDAARIPNLAASKITSGTMSQLRVQPIYYQAHGSGDLSLSAGTQAQVALVTTGALSSGSGLSIVSGGIKITTAGRYRVTASVYVSNSATEATGRGVYIRRATSSGAFSAASEILAAVDVSSKGSGAICCGPKILALSANDIIYLAARSMGAAGSCDKDNAGTFLLIERLS